MAISRFKTSTVAQGLPKYQDVWDGTTDLSVQSGLVLSLDVGKTASYSGSGSTWTDLVSGTPFTLYNSPTFTSNGASSYLRFNGSNQYAEGSVAGLISGLSDATCSVWYRPLSVDNDAMIFDHHTITSGDVRDNFSIRQVWGGSTPQTAGYTVNSSGTFTSVNFEATNSFLNTWRNYTLVRRGGSFISFVNGTQANSTSITGTIRTSNFLRIAQDAINSNHLNADFAVVQTWNRGLSNAEVTQQFNFYKGRYGY
jgi:hypothetical protein